MTNDRPLDPNGLWLQGLASRCLACLSTLRGLPVDASDRRERVCCNERQLHSGCSVLTLLPEKTRRNVIAACMDRNGSYPNVVKRYCPNAEIVYDKFHIVKNLNEAVDQVRREETKEAEKNKKRFIKGERYNLLRHSENLKPEQRVSLQTLLDLNEKINEAYMLKETFRNFWTYRYLGCARTFLSWWMSLALESGLRPMIKFGTGLFNDLRSLLNILKFGMSNAAIERFNGTVSRVIARGHGYRDERYLFLKLRQQSVKKQTLDSAIMR